MRGTCTSRPSATAFSVSSRAASVHCRRASRTDVRVLQNCYFATRRSWESSIPDFQAMEASRKATFLAAEKVICLVTAMMQTQVLDNDIAECDNLNVDTSALNLPRPRKPPKPPRCDLSSVSPGPCDKGFVAQYYTSQEWYAEAPADTCTPCASDMFSNAPTK